MGGQQPADKSFWEARSCLENNSLRFTRTYNDDAHQGLLFMTGFLFEGVADDAWARLLLINVPRQELLVFGEVNCQGDSYLNVFQGATYSDEGTELTIINHNSSGSAPTSNITAYHTPTITDNGNVFHPQALVTGGSGPKTIGASYAEDAMFVVRPNGNLLIAIQNKAGQAKDIFIHVNWTEHTELSFATTTTTTSSTTTTTA